MSSPYGTPRNVFEASHVPGGSSSDSGVAVTAAIVDFALGADTAGSGRVPACRSIDSISVFARSVAEALAVQRVIVGYDVAYIAALCDPEVARLLYDRPWVAERTDALREVIENRPEIVYPAVRGILQADWLAAGKPV